MNALRLTSCVGRQQTAIRRRSLSTIYLLFSKGDLSISLHIGP